MYTYLSHSNINASIDCTIGKMVQLISQSFLWAVKIGADCTLAMLTMTKPSNRGVRSRNVFVCMYVYRAMTKPR